MSSLSWLHFPQAVLSDLSQAILISEPTELHLSRCVYDLLRTADFNADGFQKQPCAQCFWFYSQTAKKKKKIQANQSTSFCFFLILIPVKYRHAGKITLYLSISRSYEGIKKVQSDSGVWSQYLQRNGGISLQTAGYFSTVLCSLHLHSGAPLKRCLESFGPPVKVVPLQ